MQHLQRYRKSLGADLLAGATGAIAGAPQAMGFALIAGVSPVYGLYAAFIGTAIGALFSSSSMVTVVPTNALALVVASTLGVISAENPVAQMFTLTFLVGVFLFVFGALRLGSLTRFVSNAVMTGFITGAGLLILLGQVRNLTGYDGPREASILERTASWLLHPERSDVQTAFIGVLAIVMIYGLRRTRFKSAANLVAIVVTSALVALLNWDGVALVRDITEIPNQLPPLVLPDLSYAPDLLTAALAMALLAAVQSAAIAKATPEPDGSPVNIDREFTAQGLANLGAAFFQGMPLGGSLSRTVVNTSAGAQTRLGNLSAGLFIGMSLVLLGGLIEQVTMAALAANLIVAAISLIKLDALRLVWNVSLSGRVTMVATLVATLVLPLEYSIYTGVLLSLALYVYTSADNIRVRQIVFTEDNRIEERPVPVVMPDHTPVVISESGNLYFASIQRLETLLPDPGDSQRPILILRMRDNQYLGSTGIQFLVNYDRQLRERGGKLLLTGISPVVRDQLERTHAVEALGPESVFDAGDELFAGTRAALRLAEDLLHHGAANVPDPPL